jgi:hypothetical protein
MTASRSTPASSTPSIRNYLTSLSPSGHGTALQASPLMGPSQSPFHPMPRVSLPTPDLWDGLDLSASEPEGGYSSPLSSSSLTPQPLEDLRDRRRRLPPRGVRVTMGHSDGLQLLADCITDGLLPHGTSEPLPAAVVHRRHMDDYKLSWVAPSHFCSGGGLGLFFHVPKDRRLPAGTLIGVYSGRSNFEHKVPYATAIAAYSDSDYVLAHPAARFVVDAMNPLTGVCAGPGRANDNFDMVNCYLNYNPVRKRMELLTRAPLGPGVYETLVNYDNPGSPPCYWSAERRARLPMASLARCLRYYPPACSQRANRSAGPLPRNGLDPPE